MILGIDTSNYTTSVAVVSVEQQLLFDQRTLLKVEEGERGLQQSAAVFQHLQNLPLLLKVALAQYREELTAISYSAQPRPLEGSYMPVFRTGEGFAETLAQALGVPLKASTHQEGHVMAGLWSAGFRPTGPFLAMHMSGGTTDLLHVEPVRGGFQIETLGSSADLHAGQFVDRVGVKLGLSFPAGPALEELALGAVALTAKKAAVADEKAEVATLMHVAEAGSEVMRLPSSVKGYTISFSGPCSAAERWIDAGEERAAVAQAVLRCIAKSVEKVVLKAVAETNLHDILFVGGVAANTLIKERLHRQLTHPAVQARVYFAEPRFSRDNAVGVALIGNQQHS